MTARRIAVLVSGGGRSLENLADRIADGGLDAEIALVLSDRDGIKALERADRLGIPRLVVPWSKELGVDGFAARAFTEFEERGVELVVLAGFLRFLRVPEAWLGRVINIHPALLPAFGGKGYYGDRVHRAVLEHHVQFTGCTVHFVDNEYDHGEIILQRCIEVRPEDTADSLGHRVFEEEMIALPEAIGIVLRGRRPGA